MDDKIMEQAYEVQDLLKQIFKRFRRLMTEQLEDLGFTVPQFMAIQELYNHPEISLKELSERLGLAKSTVSGIIDRLEAQDSVIRLRDTDDRRNVKISLTPRMQEIKKSLVAVKNNYLAVLMKDVDEQETEKILVGLRSLQALMNSEGTDGDKGCCQTKD